MTTAHDGHGTELIEFCKMTSSRIVNGRIGKFTCYQPSGNSTVDYLLAKEKDFDKLLDFEIADINDFYDQAFLDIKIKINIHSQEKRKANYETIENDNPDIPSDDVSHELRADYNFKFNYQQEDTQKNN